MYNLRFKDGLLYADAIICHEGNEVTIPDVIIDTYNMTLNTLPPISNI